MEMAHRELREHDEMSPLFHDWLEYLELYEDKPSHTVRAYGQAVRRFVSFADDVHPKHFNQDSFDRETLMNAVAAMRSSGIKKSTLNQTLAALKSFYGCCVDKRLLDQPPVDFSRIRKLTKIDPPPMNPNYYFPSELERLLTEAAKGGKPSCRVRWAARDLAMCSFLVGLGLRSAELFNADVGWVGNERLIEGDHSAPWMLRVKGKGGIVRRLPLSNELLLANERWQAERTERFGPTQPDSPLFVTNDGARFNYQRLRYWLRLLNKEAGVGVKDHTLHALRHTTGVQLAAEGVPMNAIQRMLGHANLSTTGIYTAIAGDELVEYLGRSPVNEQLRKILTPAISSKGIRV